jgi:hypothetical protein
VFFVAVAVLVAAAGLALMLTSSTSAPRHIADWYVGSWRVAAPMVGMRGGHLVPQAAAPTGIVLVSSGKNGLSISMRGFPGVPSAAVPGQRTPLQVIFQTPDAGQGIGNWSLVLRSPAIGALSFYDPATDSWSAKLALTRR